MFRASIKNHSALFVMLIVSFSIFLINVIAKNNLSNEVYSWFVIYFIYIGYVSSLGFSSSDNVFLRYVVIDNSTIIVESSLLYFMLGSFFIAGITLYFFGFYIIGDYGIKNLVYYVIPFILISFLFFLSIIERLGERYVTAQFIQNGWKVIFLFIFGALIVSGYEISNYNIAICLVLSVFLLFIYSMSKKKCKWIKSTKKSLKIHEIFFTQIAYLLSSVFFLIMESMDRLVLKDKMDALQFSEYAYLIILFLYPVNIISNYIGYRELIQIKKGKEIKLIASVIKLTIMAVFFYLCYTFVLFLLNPLLQFQFDFAIWIAILIIVAIKMPYSLLSALLGGKAESKDLLKLNIVNLLFLMFFITLISYYPNKYLAIYSISFLWFLRYILFYLTAKKYA